MDSVTTVPLKKLTLSDRNVRETVVNRDVADIASAIEARGLDQNLIVIPSGRAGNFEVIAGGLRYRALLKLLAEKKVRSDLPVAVKVVAAEDARVISLSENIDRVAMNPADEIRAFAAIHAEHANEVDPVAFVARRTGRSRDIVEQRLRLYKLPAEILDALREAKITVAAANSYGAVPDPDLQLQVFKAEEARTFGDKHRPSSVRDALTMRTLPVDCPRARYVGLDAYLAAGGRTATDLFMGADAREALLDPSLLERLAKEKAEDELGRRVQRDGFASGLLVKGLFQLSEWPQLPKGYRIGGRARDPETQSVLPAFEVRPTAIGIYGVALGCLSPIGWLEPEAAVVVADEPSGTPRLAERHEAYFPAGGAGGDRAPRPGQELHDRALELVAARIAAEHIVGETFADNAQWPNEKHGFVPPIDTAIGDDDTILVTVQIRVSRAELEAHIHEAEEQMEANAQANDRVAEAGSEPPDSGGGGKRRAFAHADDGGR
ncbi:ParB family chromosome partitioning protein [Sphingomonas vulcanisoli]|uniref:ParB family chromosome partitioning protein n=2 Tax=Sphingomonas vulcanisoli TaxID=1658060 RepID=A0ABX0TNW9_9SPHN|nr:ParB family chromosome partitioning protein [Sphingomonas vulcanisoli]